MVFSLVTILSVSPLLWSPNDPNGQIEVISSGKFKIKGQSNIAPFECEFQPYSSTDTLSIGYTKEAKPCYYFHNAITELDIAAFDCGNRVMNNDFCEMLHQEQHPRLKIQLKDATISTDNNGGSATITIGIAGLEKDYNLPFEWHQQDGKYQVLATIHLDIKDFELIPPQKLIGLLKVRNEITVEVEYEIRPLVFE